MSYDLIVFAAPRRLTVDEAFEASAGQSRLLRTSPDLLRWSQPMAIRVATGYGLLLNAQTSSNGTVNSAGFHIETTNDGELGLQHAELNP